MKVGIICSSGGSVIRYAADIWRGLGKDIECYLVTDRYCGAQSCLNFSHNHIQINESNSEVFSKKSSQWFVENDVTSCLLLFSRIVSKELFNVIDTVNIHPSFLPAYKGFKAVERAFFSSNAILGATLHKANDDVDGGPILAQACNNMASIELLSEWHRVSFAQKVYLTLVWFESVGNSARSLKPLCSDTALAFEHFIHNEGIIWKPLNIV